jgi:hypothetical protein
MWSLKKCPFIPIVCQALGFLVNQDLVLPLRKTPSPVEVNKDMKTDTMKKALQKRILVQRMERKGLPDEESSTPEWGGIRKDITGLSMKEGVKMYS